MTNQQWLIFQKEGRRLHNEFMDSDDYFQRIDENPDLTNPAYWAALTAFEAGHDQGYDVGHSDGYSEGFKDGRNDED